MISLTQLQSELDAATPGASPLKGPDLETLLLQLARHGQPRIALHREGWFCVVDMNTNATGASFEIRSEFKMETPLAAAKQCMERVQTALKTLGRAALEGITE